MIQISMSKQKLLRLNINYTNKNPSYPKRHSFPSTSGVPEGVLKTKVVSFSPMVRLSHGLRGVLLVSCFLVV